MAAIRLKARADSKTRQWIRVAVLGEAAIVGVVLWLVGGISGLGGSVIRLVELDDGVLFGSRRATVIDIFEEPLCSPCGRFEAAKGADLERAVTSRRIAVRYHLLNRLDRDSASGDYSTRVLAATLCVADTGDPDLFWAFVTATFKTDFQPKENAPHDRTNADLAQLAQTVKTPPSARQCITFGRQVQHAKDMASRAAAALQGLMGADLSVPRVFEGSREVDWHDTAWLDTLL